MHKKVSVVEALRCPITHKEVSAQRCEQEEGLGQLLTALSSSSVLSFQKEEAQEFEAGEEQKDWRHFQKCNLHFRIKLISQSPDTAAEWVQYPWATLVFSHLSLVRTMGAFRGQRYHSCSRAQPLIWSH